MASRVFFTILAVASAVSCAAAASMTTLALPVDATAVAGGNIGFSVVGTASDGQHTTYLASVLKATSAASGSGSAPSDAPVTLTAGAAPTLTVVLAPTNAVIYAPRVGGGMTTENCTWAAGRAHPVAQCIQTDVTGKNLTTVVPVNRVAVMVEPQANGAVARSLVSWATAAGAGLTLALSRL